MNVKTTGIVRARFGKSKIGKPKRERFQWVDILKGVSIFGVVYIHSGLGKVGFVDGGDYFRFCVPVFIMLSFFLSEQALYNSKRKCSRLFFLKRRLIRLILPYAVWTFFYAVGQFYLGITSTMDFGPVFAWQGQYFFVVLIQLTLLYPWLRVVKIDEARLLILFILTSLGYVSVSYLGIHVPFFLRGEAPFFYWVFYMFLGIYMVRESRKINDLLHRLPFSLLFGLILLIPFSIVLEGAIVQGFPYLRVSVLLVSTVAIIVFQRLDDFSESSIFKLLKSFIKPLSRYSLGVFCLNSIIISSILNMASYVGVTGFSFSQSPLLAFLPRFIIAVITCILSVWICKLLDLMRCSSLVK